MRLAKGVALVSQRRTVLPSFSERLLSTPTSQGLHWGYRNEWDMFPIYEELTI